MKTNEFIKLLQEADPENKADVCVGNCPVSFVDFQPYYYDGRQQFVERVNGVPVRGGYPTGTWKLKICYDTLEDALMDNPDMELDLSGVTYNGKVEDRYMDCIKEWIEEGRKFVAWQKEAREAKEKGLPLPPILSEEDYKPVHRGLPQPHPTKNTEGEQAPKQTWLRKIYNWFMSLEPDWLKQK